MSSVETSPATAIKKLKIIQRDNKWIVVGSREDNTEVGVILIIGQADFFGKIVTLEAALKAVQLWNDTH